MKIKFFATVLLIACIACSKTSEIKSIVGVENSVTVIKEKEGFYWAIPGKGIEKVDGDQIYINEDVIVSYGKGEGNIKRISETLRNNRQTQQGEYQATGSTITETINGKEVVTKLYECFTGRTSKPIVLTVVETVDVIK